MVNITTRRASSTTNTTLSYCGCVYNSNILGYIIGLIFVVTALQCGFNLYIYANYSKTFTSYSVSYFDSSSTNQNNFPKRDILNSEISSVKQQETDFVQNKVNSNKTSGIDLFKYFVNQILLNIKVFFAPAPLPTPPRPLCPEGYRKLAGKLRVREVNYQEDRLGRRFIKINAGGRWRPRHCTARYKVAIIVPYRDRRKELGIFLRHMHPFLQRQNLNYGIYIIEQTFKSKFNRGFLMNIGFVEAMARAEYDCMVLHDVDMLPEDDRILYDCPAQPRHMASGGSKWHYRLPYGDFFGGVTAFSSDHYRLINGFSNIYFGWGAEDDDLYRRVQHKNLTVIRYNATIARYKVLKHKQAELGVQKNALLQQAKTRFDLDGLNDLENLDYEILNREYRKLYTWIFVDVNSKTVIDHISNKTGRYPPKRRVFQNKAARRVFPVNANKSTAPRNPATRPTNQITNRNNSRRTMSSEVHEELLINTVTPKASKIAQRKKITTKRPPQLVDQQLSYSPKQGKPRLSESIHPEDDDDDDDDGDDDDDDDGWFKQQVDY